MRDLEDSQEVIQAAAEFLGKHLGAARVGFAELEDDGAYATIEGEWRRDEVSSIAGRYLMADYGTAFAPEYSAGHTVVVSDFACDPRSINTPAVAAHEALGIRAQVIVPLLTGGRLKALLFVHSDIPRRWSAEDVVLIEDVAERIQSAIERARVETTLVETERRLNAILNNTREAVFLLDKRQHCVYANPAAQKLTGYDFEQMQGKPLHDVIHHKRSDGSHYPLEECPIDRAFPERAQMSGEELFVAPDGSLYPVAFTASPVLDVEGRPVGTVIEARGIAQEKARDAALQETADRYRLVAGATNDVIWDWRIADGHVLWNEALSTLFGHTETETSAAWWLDHIHPGDRDRIDHGIHAVIEGSGERWLEEYRFRRADGSFADVLDRGAVLRDAQGQGLRMIGAMLDLTERKAAEERLRESDAKFQAIANSVDQMIWSTTPDGYHDYYNQRWYEFTGVPPGSTDGLEWKGIFHPDDQERAWNRWQRCLESGETYEIEYRLRHHSGTYRWVLGRAQAERDTAGRITRWYGSCTDIHDLKVAEDALRKSRDQLAAESHALEILNATGTQVAAELGLEALVQTVVEAGVALTGARFGAFFYNVLDARGESYTLYALAGADRSQFDSFGMPRATAVFAPTFRGESVIRSDDIHADPRYGQNAPHKGMPEGHLPVRSYLAVPVASRSGEVIGGLFFGHESPGVFTERAERVMTGLAAQAAIAIDNARLFDRVQKAKEELEERVQARTLELEEVHEALRQSQKMEAVGQLTGGIAHDFNNMLAVVIGSLDLLGRRIGTSDARAKRYVDAAADGARRAALLTQRLLAFSRQQPLRPEPIEANKLVAGMSDLLRHSLGADIQLEAVLAGGLWRTHADPNQLENVLLNLAVNARDAMPGGGKLTVETQNAHLDDRYTSAHPGVMPGQYVLIAVTDTGTGMPPDVIAKAFDPFYTTKEVGKGTGLGLSQVYGFVKQSGGHVKIYSEPGQGTTVKVYLPRYLGAADEIEENNQPGALQLGEDQEVVLVVEDEPSVRQFSVDALLELGYRVLEADGAPAALRMLDAHPEVALMFTDVVMPEVNGAKLAEEARRRRPDLKILFMTGYTRNAVVHNGVLDPGVQMIGKPFTIEELAAKVREVLDRTQATYNSV